MRKLFFLVIVNVLFIGCNSDKPAEQKSETTDSADNEAKEVAPAEFADAKYSEMGKKAIAAFSNGDVDGWLADYQDNSVFVWNNGDSLAGKPAIFEYWKKRRTEVIDSITFSNDIWLPVKVNKPQSIEAPGVWLLGWYQINVKYKTGKKMSQWIHTDLHFDATDKIDRAIMYVDRALINEGEK